MSAVIALAACDQSSALLTPSPSVSAGITTTPPASPAAPGAQPPVASPATSPVPPPNSVCRTPSEHVYHPYRLQVRVPCMTVSGTVNRIKDEPDGDYHVRLYLDPQFSGLINDANNRQQAGDLILEPVCIHAITQADAVSACAGYANPLTMPPPYTHVVATGAYVLDTEHGWMELHPLWEIHPG